MTAAARAWAAGGLVDDIALDAEPEAVLDARRFGMPEEQVKALQLRLTGRAQGGFAGVWPDNSDVVDAFLAVATQWRTGMQVADGKLHTVWIGLDYAAAIAALAARDMTVSPDVFAGVQIMEQAARDAMNGRAR